jgi:hypothetical protein
MHIFIVFLITNRIIIKAQNCDKEIVMCNSFSLLFVQSFLVFRLHVNDSIGKGIVPQKSIPSHTNAMITASDDS